MATSGFIFTTLHYDGAHNAPLPVREKSLGVDSGSIVCQIDWAFLVDTLMERQQSTICTAANVYPHGVETYGTLEGFDRFMANYKPSAESRFIDPDATPQSGDGQWAAPAFVPCAPSIYGSPKRPRSMDTMRRMFYDVKRLTRWSCTASHEYKDDFGAWRQGAYPLWSKNSIGDETFHDPQANRRSPTALDSIHADVRSAGGWSIAPAFAAVEFRAWRLGGAYQYKHLVVLINADGSIPPSGWTASDCKTFAASKGFTGNDSYCDARVVGAYYDCAFPRQGDFVGWNWEPGDGS